MEVLNYLSLVLGVVSLVGVLWGVGYRQGKLEVKVDTMWDFQLKRGFSEGLQEAMLQTHSPLKTTSKARDMMMPVLDRVRQFYSEKGHRLSDPRLFEAIHAHFGDEILEKIALPRQLLYGSCIATLIKICREDFPSNISHPDSHSVALPA